MNFRSISFQDIGAAGLPGTQCDLCEVTAVAHEDLDLSER